MEFWLSIAASPSFPSGPLSLPNLAGLDCERTNERPRSNYMRRLPTRSRFLPVLYYECDITRPRPFVSHKPTPTSITTYLCLFSFLLNFFASVLSHIVTHSTHLFQRLSFHLHLPLTLLRLGVAKSVRYPLPVPGLDFTHPPPHFPSCRRKTPLTFFFDYATRNCTLHCSPVQTQTSPSCPVHVCLLEILICSSHSSK